MEFQKSKKKKHCFLFRSGTLAFHFFQSMSESPLVCLHLEAVATFMSSQQGDFPEDPCSSSSLLNKPHDIYNRVNTQKELSKCSFLLLTCSVCVVAIACSIVRCQVTEQMHRPSILPILNGAIREAPTCGRSGI